MHSQAVVRLHLCT